METGSGTKRKQLTAETADSKQKRSKLDTPSMVDDSARPYTVDSFTECVSPDEDPHKKLYEFLIQKHEQLQLAIVKKNGVITDTAKKIEMKSMQLNSARETMFKIICQMFSMRPSCIVPLENKQKDEHVVIYRKYNSAELEKIQSVEMLHYPYYGVRVQTLSLKKRERDLREKYPFLEKLMILKVPNSVNFFNYIFEEMGNVLERGKGEHVQSFRVKNYCMPEAKMLDMIRNLYSTQYAVGWVNNINSLIQGDGSKILLPSS